MLHTITTASGIVPYVGLLAGIAVHLRQLALLIGFLVGVRGVSGKSRSDMFTTFAQHLTARPLGDALEAENPAARRQTTMPPLSRRPSPHPLRAGRKGPGTGGRQSAVEDGSLVARDDPDYASA